MKLELFLEKMYEKNYKRFIFISLGLLVLSLVILGINYASKGSVIERDISLMGFLEQWSRLKNSKIMLIK